MDRINIRDPYTPSNAIIYVYLQLMCRNDMQLVLSTSGINGYSSLEYSLSYSTEYSTPKLLVSGSPNYKKLCYCRRRARRNLSVKIGIRDDGIAANTAMITVHRAQQNLHHCQKSTLSRYYYSNNTMFTSINCQRRR